MSDQLNHECGLALIRLLKPLDFYKKKIWNINVWFKQTLLDVRKTT